MILNKKYLGIFFVSIITKMEIKKMPKNAKKYYCTKCDFGTDKMSNYINNLSTRKQSMEIYGNKKMPNCKNCEIQFKSNSGLWKHEKKMFSRM